MLEALREQEVCNFKLKQYINGILMRVITLHPEILEIPAPAEDARGEEGRSKIRDQRSRIKDQMSEIREENIGITLLSGPLSPRTPEMRVGRPKIKD